MSLALLDTNILVHAAFKSAEHYLSAANILDEGLRQAGRYCVSPQNLIEFAAVTSRARHVVNPLSAEQINRITRKIYSSRTLHKIYPKRATAQRAIEMGMQLKISGPEWYDLHLAMTMRDNGVQQIVTLNQKDFLKFPFVKAVALPG